jgi:hypothetical protein
MARVALARMVAAVLVGTGLFILAVRDVPYEAHKATLGVLGVLFLFTMVLYHNAKSHRSRAQVGGYSEQRVAAVLASMAPVALLNSVLLGAGGDADHVILGPQLAVIETKTGWGEVSFDGHTMRAGARSIPGNPVAQVQRQAAVLHDLVQEYTDAVVCVVDMTNPPLQVGSTTVCSLADLPQVLRRLPARLDGQKASHLYARLTSLHESTAPTNVIHS